MTVQVIGRAVDCAGKVVAVAGDHAVETVYFNFDREPADEVALRVQSGWYQKTSPLLREGMTASWTVPQEAALQAGELTCQLVQTDRRFSPPHVWQSEIFRLVVLPTLTMQ